MSEALSAYERIWETVARIPAGRVATYGQIARLAGLGKRARMVGYALHRTPDHYDIPWHRVINAQGRISFPPDSEQYRRQRDRLTAEDIPFTGERVDLAVYRWRPGLEDAPEMYFDD
jgi:methylated-DNA-protein-cysteine methyltransferase-like protein